MMASPMERRNPNCDAVKHLLQFRCISNFWNSLISLARKHFKLKTTTTTRSDTLSTNPNIRKQSDITNPNIRKQSDITNPKVNIDSLPTLPFDLITEILSRLPVNLLLQFRCVSKLWNSLIHDPKFAKKHLTHSTTHSLSSLCFTYSGILTMCPPNFSFNTAEFTNLKHSVPPSKICNWVKEIVGSCNGILCFAYKEFIQLCNPSILKLNDLPVLQNPGYSSISYGFGYDSFTDHYKVVAVLWNHYGVDKTQVKVNTLGTNIWKNIEEFPFGTLPHQKSGKCVSGTINWLASSKRWPRLSPPFIVSFDLGNESYRKVLLPDDEEVNANPLILDVFTDCLCMISGHDVWCMKEYGITESWTKLFTISYSEDPTMRYSLTKVVYVFEDGQVLLQIKRPFFRTQMIVYDPRIGTFKFITFQKSIHGPLFPDLDVSKYGGLVVCIESLISPCS